VPEIVNKVEEKVKGKIVVEFYEGKLPKIEFEGNIVGADMNLLWRGLTRGYRQWKANLLKKKEV